MKQKFDLADDFEASAFAVYVENPLQLYLTDAYIMFYACILDLTDTEWVTCTAWMDDREFRLRPFYNLIQIDAKITPEFLDVFESEETIRFIGRPTAMWGKSQRLFWFLFQCAGVRGPTVFPPSPLFVCPGHDHPYPYTHAALTIEQMTSRRRRAKVPKLRPHQTNSWLNACQRQIVKAIATAVLLEHKGYGALDNINHLAKLILGHNRRPGLTA